jgi:hypothetical protein
MTEQARPRSSDADRVWKVVIVKAPAVVAWRVFTEEMGAWWPLATHKIGTARAVVR